MPVTEERRGDRHPQEVKSVPEKVHPQGTVKEEGDEEGEWALVRQKAR